MQPLTVLKARNILDDLKESFASELAAVDTVILSHVEGAAPFIPELARHVLASGGKRLRPLLTLVSARLCGYDSGRRHINLAACVEFIHTATLLHDDVVDESNLRRGVKTANAMWGNQASVLVGDFLLGRAFQLMVGDGSLPALKILSDTSAIIAEGEVMQLTTQRNLDTPLETYLKVISAKTAQLFAAACEVGAVVAQESETRNQKPEEALLQASGFRVQTSAYGHHLGIAFQILDDVLDYSAKQERLGKTIGDDFREGKMTLPVILAYSKATSEERTFWERSLRDRVIAEGDLARAVEAIQRTQALKYAMEYACRYVEKAKQALAEFPESAEKAALLDLADFAVDREY